MNREAIEARRLALSEVAELVSCTLGQAVIAVAQLSIDIASDNDALKNFERGRLLARAFACIEETTRLARGQLVALEVMPEVTR